MPVRFATRKMCVSTAIAGSLNQVFSTTFAVLRPTPGRLCSAARDEGTSPPKSSTRMRDSFITCRALLLKSPMVLMCAISPASPSASIFSGRVRDLEERLGRPVDPPVGRLRRERDGDEQGEGAGVRELALRLGLRGVEPPEDLGDRRIVELLGHGPRFACAPRGPARRFRRFRVVPAAAATYLPGNRKRETVP